MLTSFYCHVVQKLPNYKYCCHSFTSLTAVLRKYLGISKILHALCNVAGMKAPRLISTVQVKMGDNFTTKMSITADNGIPLSLICSESKRHFHSGLLVLV